MTTLEIIFTVLAGLVVLPVIAYMVMKFGTAGFLRAKEREKQKRQREL